MVSVARDATLLFSLPVPELTSAAAPLLISTEHAHNENVALWWSERQNLSRLCRSLQTALIQGPIEPMTHISRLHDLISICGHTQRYWKAVLGFLYARGSALRVEKNFVPTWITLAPMRDFAVFEIGADAANPLISPTTQQPSEMQHKSVALVFESVCIQYLLAALTQQMAIVAPSTAVACFENCRTLLTTLCTNVLPRYFALHDGRETVLLSEHFYKQFLLAIVESQANNAAARSALGMPEPDSVMTSRAALQLWTASRQLDMAGSTLFANKERLGGMARHREAMALVAIAHIFGDAELAMENTVLDYQQGEVAVDKMFENLATEAYFCLRAARLLLSASPAVAARFEAASKRLNVLYDIVHAQPPNEPPSPATIYEARTSYGLAHAEPWKSELGHITIGKRHSNASFILATHSPKSFGSQKRHFLVSQPK